MKNPQTTRQVAFAILKVVINQKKSIELAFANDNIYNSFEPRDKAFTRQLVMIVLRYRKLLTYSYEKFLKNKLPAKQRDLSLVFQIATAQILYMNVPDYAAVNSSVELAKNNKLKNFAGLLNATLKNIAKNKDKLLAEAANDKIYTIPRWLKQSWEKQYDAETILHIIDIILTEPKTDITLKPTENKALWAEKLGGELLPTGSIRLSGSSGKITDLAGFDDGAWWVQDIAATLPAMLLKQIKPLAGETVLDLCAAPGGKTAQLAAEGANVIAVDRSENRLKRLAENMNRLKLSDNVEVIAKDILQYQEDKKFSTILLDAPCTATGTLRRHPDIMWNKNGKDITELTKIQNDILTHTVNNLLADDGILVYCTCSLEQAEGEQQINEIIAENDNIERIKITAEIAQKMSITADSVTADGDLRILPIMLAKHGGNDGFFISALRKS